MKAEGETSIGGKTPHAAVVARGVGKTAVCGAESISVDEHLQVIAGLDGW